MRVQYSKPATGPVLTNNQIMKKLLKAYGFNSDMQYYSLIRDSFFNGQRSQAWEQFLALPKPNRVAFLKAATVDGWDCGLGDHILKQLFDLILK